MLSNLVSGITKVGEGYDGEINEPIDIHYHKLLEWLVDRRKLQANWKQELRKVKEKVAAAVPQLPEDNAEIKALLKDYQPADVHYFVCKRIFEALEKTDEAKERNLFGQYSARRLRDWQDIVKSYEHHSVYLGEAAEILISTVKYELPSLSKRVDRWRNQVDELARKENDLVKAANDHRARYERECAAMGIPGKDVKAELRGMLSELPQLLNEVADLVQSNDTVERACQFYREFIRYTTSVPLAGVEREAVDVEVCPTLMRVYRNGNERLHGGDDEDKGSADETGAPAAIDWGLGGEDTTTAAAEGGGPAIDWSVITLEDESAGGDDAAAAGGAAISWDIAVEGEGSSENGEPAILNWDITTAGTDGDGAAAAVDAAALVDEAADSAAEINWDISVEAEGEAAIELEAAGESAATSGGLDAGDKRPRAAREGAVGTTLLEDTELRNQFLTDLLELQAFLRQRRAESEGGDQESSSWLHEEMRRNAPAAARQSAEAVAAFETAVAGVIGALQHQRKLRQLLEIQNSNKYLERLAAQINQHMTSVNAVEASRREAVRQRGELQESIGQTHPRIAQLTRLARELRRQIETALAAQYTNRKVSLIGGDLQNLK